MRRIVACAIAAVGLVACFETVEPLPLDIVIEPPTNITTVDSVNFVVSAQGSSVVGVEATFGDGEMSFFNTGGARTAKLTFRHRYTQSGTYDVTATATDAVLGTKSVSVQVNVQ